jgi:replicative DNA helicase
VTLSAPLFILKRQARALCRREGIPLHAALDRIAAREGYAAWSLLCDRWDAQEPPAALLARLVPGELLLLASRPGQGKTLLALGLCVEALARGGSAAFFTLDFTPEDVARGMAGFGRDADEFGERFVRDHSDAICAAHIEARLADAPAGTLVVVDYLQLLDQKREHPPLAAQVQALRRFARSRGAIVVCLSQVDRRYDPARGTLPGPADVRLPNPLDLALFDRACFLHAGRMAITSSAP